MVVKSRGQIVFASLTYIEILYFLLMGRQDVIALIQGSVRSCSLDISHRRIGTKASAHSITALLSRVLIRLLVAKTIDTYSLALPT